jgi:predicted Zn-dependent protease
MQIKALILIILLLFTVDTSAFAEKKPKNSKGRISKRYKTKEAKYEAAKTYYAKGAYLSAAQLFEEIYPLYSNRTKSVLFNKKDNTMIIKFDKKTVDIIYIYCILNLFYQLFF